MLTQEPALPADSVAGGQENKNTHEVGVEAGQPADCLLESCSGQLASTGHGPLAEALQTPNSSQTCPSKNLPCAGIPPHPSSPSLTRTDGDGSPVWLQQFRISDKGGLDHQRELGVPVQLPSAGKALQLHFGSLHSDLSSSTASMSPAGTAQPSTAPPEAAAGCTRSCLLLNL